MILSAIAFLSAFLTVIVLHSIISQATPFQNNAKKFQKRDLSPGWDPKLTPYTTVHRDDISFSYRSAATNGNVTIADPYNYLEQLPSNSKEVQEFMNQQSAFFKQYAKNVKDLDVIRTSIKDADSYDELQFPQAYGSKDKMLFTFYYRPRESDFRQYYVATQEQLEQGIQTKFTMMPGKMVLDEADLGGLTSYFQNISPDGKKFLYRTMVPSSRKPGTIHIRDISNIFTSSDSVKDYPEQIKSVGDTSDGWNLDSNGFFYLHNDKDYFDGTDVVLYHKLGTPVEEDIVIVKADKDKYESLTLQLSRDKRYIIISISSDSDKSRVYAASLDQTISTNMKWISIEPEEDLELEYVQIIANEFYFLARYDNDTNQIIKYTIDKTKATPVENLKDLKEKAQMVPTMIPEDKSVLIDRFTIIDTDKILLCFTQDAKRNFFIYDLKTGKRIQHVLPDFIGSSSSLTSLATGKDVFLWSWTFNAPEELYHIKWNPDHNKASSELIFKAKLKSIDLSQFTVELKYAVSKDGTKIPFHIFYRKGTKFDGTKAAMLNFFGAFGTIWLPYYDATYMTWVNDYDAIFILAYPRGGAEVKGEEWHKAGMLNKKQNTLDDVNAVIQYLIDNKIAAKGKIVLYGQYAGSIATMAVVNQAPEGNIGAVILSDALHGSYGEYDLLRFNTAPGTESDVAEYGDPQDPKAFDWLRKISPLHNINKSKVYPAIVFRPGNDTATSWHARKMISELQFALPNNSNPFLFNSPDQALTDAENINYGHPFPIAFAAYALDLQRKST